MKTTEPNRTDLGNAQRFAELHGEEFRFVADMGGWFKWSGYRWKSVLARVDLRRAAKEVTRAIYTEATGIADEMRRSEVARHALRSESRQRIDAMIELAAAEPVFEVLARELDANPMLLTCGNGTLNLETGELQTPKREDLVTRATCVSFEPRARAPRWLRFLDEIYGGRMDLIEFTRRAIGYTLTGRVDAQCFFLLHGEGCNGKSVLLNVLLALLGQCGMTAPFDTFVKKAGDTGIPNDVAAMRGARLVVASEGEEGAQLAESRVKMLTGGDQISARFMRGEFFQFHPVLKLWLATNHIPEVRGTGPAIWRRMRLVPFGVDFRGRENPQLQQELLAELPGILAWAVGGCQDWLVDGGGAKGLDVSQTVRDAIEVYREESDVLGQFLEEQTVRGDGETITTKRLFAAYTEWCAATRRSPMTQQHFGRNVAKRGFISKPSNGQRRYRGLGLRNTKQRQNGSFPFCN